MIILRILFGALLLFFGHRLFWLFAALAGFLFGIQTAALWGGSLPQWIQILLSIGVGLVMAVLTVISVRLASMAVGFIAAWILVGEALNTINISAGPANMVLLIVAGVVGAFLALAVFDLALILLSSFAGAGTIVSALSTFTGLAGQNVLLFVLGLVLGVIGFVFQWRELNRRERSPD